LLSADTGADHTPPPASVVNNEHVQNCAEGAVFTPSNLDPPLHWQHPLHQGSYSVESPGI